MSERNIAVVRAYYEAVNGGDAKALFALYTDDVEFVNPGDAADPGTRVGREGLKGAHRNLAATFEDYRCEVLETEPVGEDRVAVVERTTGRGTSSGAPFEAVHGHLFTIRDGRVARFEWFRGPEEMRAALADEVDAP